MKKIITTHLRGILTNSVNEPYNNAEIIIEMTDADDSFTGLTTSVFTDRTGKYDFKLQGGYYNIYVVPTPDDIRVKIGKVHVATSDFNTLYTLEELINK